jgi:hypothetical protein
VERTEKSGCYRTAPAGRAPCFLASTRSVAPDSSARRSSPKHPIRGAANRRWTAVQDVRVDHGGAHVTVSEQFLDRANVVTVFEEMRCEGVPEGETRGSLGQARLEDGFLDRPLEHGFMEVMPPPLPGDAIGVETGHREGPLPAPTRGLRWNTSARVPTAARPSPRRAASLWRAGCEPVRGDA